jgi:hypothetical protein
MSIFIRLKFVCVCDSVGCSWYGIFCLAENGISTMRISQQKGSWQYALILLQVSFNRNKSQPPAIYVEVRAYKDWYMSSFLQNFVSLLSWLGKKLSLIKNIGSLFPMGILRKMIWIEKKSKRTNSGISSHDHSHFFWGKVIRIRCHPAPVTPLPHPTWGVKALHSLCQHMLSVQCVHPAGGVTDPTLISSLNETGTQNLEMTKNTVGSLNLRSRRIWDKAVIVNVSTFI